jgi:hypothetical protein
MENATDFPQARNGHTRTLRTHFVPAGRSLGAPFTNIEPSSTRPPAVDPSEGRAKGRRLLFFLFPHQHELLAHEAARLASGVRELRLAALRTGAKRNRPQRVVRPPRSRTSLGHLFYRKHGGYLSSNRSRGRNNPTRTLYRQPGTQPIRVGHFGEVVNRRRTPSGAFGATPKRTRSRR